MKIWFDMDGTIADLYGVDGWLESLHAHDTRPYEVARGIGNLALIARMLNKVQKSGHEIGVISWTARIDCEEYNARIATAKINWLKKHLPSVRWDYVKVVRYGMNKKDATAGDILFDDEEGNRKAWGKGAYEPREIVRVLKALA